MCAGSAPDALEIARELDDLLQRDAGTGANGVREALEETNALMERQLRRLREAVMRIRLVPVGEAFERAAAYTVKQ